MDEQSIEPARAPEDPIAEPHRPEEPSVGPGYSAAQSQSAQSESAQSESAQSESALAQPVVPPSPWQAGAPSYAPPADWQQSRPQNPWQQTQPVANLPQSTWQPGNQPTVTMQAGEPVPVANLPQSPWQPTGQGPMAPVAGGRPQPAWPAPEAWHPPLLTDAGLPPGWHAPLRTDLVPLKQRKRPSKRLIAIAAAVVVLLVAGVTTWLVWPPDRSPFEQAVANLATQPVVNYTAELPDGSQWDGRVTKQGDAVGWLTSAGLKFPFLITNGTLYVELDGLFPPGIEDPLPTGIKLTNRWATGDLGDLAPLLKQEVTPSAIADKLRDEVARTEKLPTPDDDGTTVNNIPVLKADTPDGTLYVAKNQPYRVVRWVDKTTRKATAAFTNPGRKLLLNGERASYTGLGTATFTPMNADDVDKTYDEMETDVGQLGDAIDTSVELKLDDIDRNDKFIECEQAGCPVTAHFTATVRPGMKPPAEVPAQMTATVTVNDVPAGGCTATAKIASSGAGTLTCVDKDMHAGFTQADNKARADAEAKAGNADYIEWWDRMQIEAYAIVQAPVDILAEAKRIESLRPDHACGWTEKGGNGHEPVYLVGNYTARIDSARYPDFEIHVFRDGQAYGDFGPSGWFAKVGAAVPGDAPKELTDQLSKAAITFMKAAGTLKDGDNTDGDKWKRPAPKC